MNISFFARLAAVAILGLVVAGCVEDGGLPSSGRGWVAISSQTQSLMNEKGMTRSDPVLLRAYKKESELEVWKKDRSGTYQLLKTYPMCRWSGQLGPKVREGDRQVPEGFYTITPGQMNPNSSYYLSFNVGYPNKLDRAFGRTGGNIMVHGACSSAGCLSMTDEQIADLYALLREAFAGGQKEVQLQSFPFRMTAKNLARYRLDPNMPFWKNLKQGGDHFDVTKREPKVAVCGRHYVFDENARGPLDASAACPPLQMDPALKQAVAQKQQRDEAAVAELVKAGEKAVRRVYADGDQNILFKEKQMAYSGGVPVSRMDAIAEGGRDVPVEDVRMDPKTRQLTVVEPVQVAAAAPVPAAAAVPTAAQGFAATPVAQPAGVTQAVAAAPGLIRMPGFMNRFSGLLGGSGEAAATPVAAQPAAGVPANVPLPPRRQASLGAGRQAATEIPAQFIGLARN